MIKSNHKKYGLVAIGTSICTNQGETIKQTAMINTNSHQEKVLKLSFLKALKNFLTIIRSTAPTTAAIKAANIFNYQI